MGVFSPMSEKRAEGIITLFDGCIERIHVDMDDFAWPTCLDRNSLSCAGGRSIRTREIHRAHCQIAFAGTPDDLVAHLKSFEERYPGMQHINLSPPLTIPKGQDGRTGIGW